MPFLGYELSLALNYDWGLYVVYLLPPVALGCAASFAGLWSVRLEGGAMAQILAAAILAFALLGNLSLRYEQRGLLAAERLAHFTDAAISAMWMRENLPEDAVVLQPMFEHNYYVMPLYLDRVHTIAHKRHKGYLLFEGRNLRWSPLNTSSYHWLKTNGLRRMLREGTPVYTLQKHALGWVKRNRLDRRRFKFTASHKIRLGVVAKAHGLHRDVVERATGRTVMVYRAE